ncbi:antitoxin [Streptomyces sp. NBC_01622]|uniref:antitoxin n=1 Tax=Streptomyces sp. NBC_01622 TaxID=2975903 RepID=UPI0038630639|nr:antitoxin [Streptomyces sp. NBC_01622]
MNLHEDRLRQSGPGTTRQAYTLDLLAREAAKPTLAEMAARLERETRTELDTTDILDAIEDGRHRR